MGGGEMHVAHATHDGLVHSQWTPVKSTILQRGLHTSVGRLSSSRPVFDQRHFPPSRISTLHWSTLAG